MGMRGPGIGIPNPQPADLNSPLPEQSLSMADLLGDQEVDFSEEDLADALQREEVTEPEPAPEPIRAPTSDPSDPLGDIGEIGVEFDESALDAIVQGQNSTITPEAREIASKVMKEGGFWERMLVSMGSTPQEQASVLASKYGNHNVQVREDADDGLKLFFRKSESEDFRPFDQDGFTIADLADWGGDALETMTSMMVEAGAIGGALATGPAAPVLAPAAAAGGAFAGGALGSFVRNRALESVGGARDESVSETDEMLWDGGMNVAFLGLGKVAFGLAGKMKQLVFDIAEAARPQKTIEKVAKMNLAVDEMARRETFPFTSEDAGIQAYGAMETQFERLGQKIGLYKEEVKEVVGNRAFMPESFVAKAQEILSNHRVKIDPQSGRANLTDEALGINTPHGREALNAFVDSYNRIRDKAMAKGGLDIEEIFDEARTLGARSSEFFEKKDAVMGRLFKNLSHSMTSDKTKIMVDALQSQGRGEEASLAQQAIEKFAKNKSNFDDFTKIWRSSQENGDLFVKAMVRKGNNTRIENFKRIVGEDSGHWKNFKASFIDTTMKDPSVTNPKNGVFDASRMLEKVNSLGTEVRRQFFSDAEFNKLRVFARRFDELGIQDIMDKANGDNVLINMMVAVGSPFSPYAMARTAWWLTKSNAKAAEFLLDRGFVDLAERAQTREQKRGFLKAIGHFGEMLENANRKRVKFNGKETDMYLFTPALRNYFSSRMIDGTVKSDFQAGPVEMPPIEVQPE